jgi:hypothetical protein
MNLWTILLILLVLGVIYWITLDPHSSLEGFNPADAYYPSYIFGYNLRSYAQIPYDPSSYAPRYYGRTDNYLANDYIYDYRPLFY